MFTYYICTGHHIEIADHNDQLYPQALGPRGQDNGPEPRLICLATIRGDGPTDGPRLNRDMLHLVH